MIFATVLVSISFKQIVITKCNIACSGVLLQNKHPPTPSQWAMFSFPWRENCMFCSFNEIDILLIEIRIRASLGGGFQILTRTEKACMQIIPKRHRNSIAYLLSYVRTRSFHVGPIKLFSLAKCQKWNWRVIHFRSYTCAVSIYSCTST